MNERIYSLETEMTNNLLTLPKAIIDEFHQYFEQVGMDNFEHIMALKMVINGVCKFSPEKAEQIKNELFEYAFDLFLKTWMVMAEEDEQEFDMKREYETARRIFVQTYEKEENIWPDD